LGDIREVRLKQTLVRTRVGRVLLYSSAELIYEGFLPKASGTS